MKIYTRTGDDGTTGLFGGARVRKDAALLDAYGTVDETNAAVGLARSYLRNVAAAEELDGVLSDIQHRLFRLGADLATPLTSKAKIVRVTKEEILWMEDTIDTYTGRLPALREFILPGGSPAAAALHLARTVCRRAERLTVETFTELSLNPECVPMLNRLSDLLFVLARYANLVEEVPEIAWRK